MPKLGKDAQADARDMAATWFVRLRSPMSDADREAFEAWRSDPENARAWAHVEQTWDQTMFLAGTPLVRSRDLSRAAPHFPVRRVAALAAMALLIGVATWTWISRGGPDHGTAPQIARTLELKAAPAGVRTVSLSDGSRVTLDRQAIVHVAFSDRERRLRLVEGRARFDVAHDAARRFVVDAGEGSVIAHGTVFDVALEGGMARIALLRGRVEVRQRSDAAAAAGMRMLAPGQEVMVTASLLSQPSAISAGGVDWASDMITFGATPLTDAIAAFNRTSIRPVRLDAPRFAQQRLSGAFRRGDPDAFARGIATSFGLSVRYDGDGAIHLDEPAAKGT